MVGSLFIPVAANPESTTTVVKGIIQSWEVFLGGTTHLRGAKEIPTLEWPTKIQFEDVLGWIAKSEVDAGAADLK